MKYELSVIKNHNGLTSNHYITGTPEEDWSAIVRRAVAAAYPYAGLVALEVAFIPAANLRFSYEGRLDTGQRITGRVVLLAEREEEPAARLFPDDPEEKCPECNGRGFPLTDAEYMRGGAPHGECLKCGGSGLANR